MSSYAVRFTTSSPLTCGISHSAIYTGFCLNSPNLNQIVSEEIYNRDFKISHPQIKSTIEIKRNIIRNILSNVGNVLPVGYIIGDKKEPLAGETARYVCSDFILAPISATQKYQIAIQDKEKYDNANLNRKILGMFIGGLPLSQSNLERQIISSLGTGKICLVLQGFNIGEQRGIIKNLNASTDEIGIFVE